MIIYAEFNAISTFIKRFRSLLSERIGETPPAPGATSPARGGFPGTGSITKNVTSIIEDTSWERLPW
jgi:hypothetical protein